MSFAEQTPAPSPAAANPEDILYQHIAKAEAIRQTLANLTDAYLHETAIIESLENQLRAQRNEAPITTNLPYIAFRVSSVEQHLLPTPRAFPN